MTSNSTPKTKTTRTAKATDTRKSQKPRKLLNPKLATHESYLDAIRRAAIKWAATKTKDHAPTITPEESALLSSIKIAYGNSPSGVLGQCHLAKWSGPKGATFPLVTVSAIYQESPVQLAITILHELGHVLAEQRAYTRAVEDAKGTDTKPNAAHVRCGHDSKWEQGAKDIGLSVPKATYTTGDAAWTQIAPGLSESIQSIAPPTEGSPILGTEGWAKDAEGRPIPPTRRCTGGDGSRGGRSRGAGSKSRFWKYQCGCPKIIRYAGSRVPLRAACLDCGEPFVLDPTSVPDASESPNVPSGPGTPRGEGGVNPKDKTGDGSSQPPRKSEGRRPKGVLTPKDPEKGQAATKPKGLRGRGGLRGAKGPLPAGWKQWQAPLGQGGEDDKTD